MYYNAYNCGFVYSHLQVTRDELEAKVLKKIFQLHFCISGILIEVDI